MTKIKILAFLVTLAIIGIGVLIGANKLARWFDYNTLQVRSPIRFQSVVVITKRGKPQPVVKTVYVKEPVCDWSRECVEAYIDFVAKGDSAFADWAKFTAKHEGNYISQDYQRNMNDHHDNGDVGSFGQFQFGKGTYKDRCEPNDNWQMDWKAQTRCAKKIWDMGEAHDRWVNTTNKYLNEKGLSKLASN